MRLVGHLRIPRGVIKINLAFERDHGMYRVELFSEIFVLRSWQGGNKGGYGTKGAMIWASLT